MCERKPYGLGPVRFDRATRARGWVALACGLAATGAGRTSASQGLPDEFLVPGTTTATATGAEVARANPGALPLVRAQSLRVVHVGEVSAGNTGLNGDALSFVTPLPLGFGLSLGASWARPEVAPSVLPVGTRVGAYGTAEVGLGYLFSQGLGVGLRLRFFGVVGADERSPAQSVEGAVGLDLGVAWRPSSWWALGVSTRNLVGPGAPALGLDRMVVGGVGVRPTGTDALTFGVDGAVAQDGDIWLRGGARVAVPHVGEVRAEGLYDFDTSAWRASFGLELAWGQVVAGGGGLVGSGDVAGYWATAGYEETRQRGLPEGGLVVTVPLQDEPGDRALVRLLWRLERLRRDPAVRAVVFAPRADVGGMAHAEELREAFGMLRRAGIRVACHLTDASGSTLYACLGVDSVTVDPAGGVRLMGLRAARYYLGATLWELGIRTDFVRIGDWKTAPEQFTRSGSTAPARQQEAQLLDDYFDLLARAVARARGVGDARARALVTGGPYTAREALAAGLVDAVGTREVAQRTVRRLAGGGDLVTLDRYVPRASRRWAAGPSVAVIYVDGDLVEGESFEVPVLGNRFSGERTVVQAIEAAARSPRVGAIVLRVDTPGGSALASDLIWRAVYAANRRKPVIASFGSVAASGGYYIGSAARELYADPACLTGSIGIFYGKADLARLLARLEVGVELNRRGERADMESVFRPYTPEERAFLATKIGEFYGVFLQRVATGRRRTAEEVDAVGRGRVFSGSRARGLGLVDRTGGLLSAVRRARVLAGLPEDHELIELPVASRGLLGTLLDLVAEDGTPTPTARLLGRSELAAPLRWLVSVGVMGDGPLALTDWPMARP